ncbi:MAG: uracil-DNA glycosylase [Clostridiales bacterium]|jgi:uracil-DNA glycosylase|nr:uracil-DNA glycosylase [Clostridiales bacterium]
MAILIGNDWDAIVGGEQEKPYYRALRQFLKREYSTATIYPPMGQIFAALAATPYEDAKVVILGQDPYINPGEAHGMSFSVLPGARMPPSLRNIFKELADDLGCFIPNNGYLMPWAAQGVLLLNTVLTVRAGASKSHERQGWEQFTDHIIHNLSGREKPLVFMLWGKAAEAKRGLIAPHHLTLIAPHPSPLARGGFFGCKHFSKANNFLKEADQSPIDWQIPNL